MKYTYEGDNKQDALVSFMKNPQKPPEKVAEKQWSDNPSEVLHLTKDTFEDSLKVSFKQLGNFASKKILCILGTFFSAGHVLRSLVWSLQKDEARI